MTNYQSSYTGEQVDNSVGLANASIQQSNISNSLGPGQNKVISQAALTALINNLQSQIDKLSQSIVVYTSTLYATKIDNSTAVLSLNPPTVSDSNKLISSATTNTDYDWSNPEFSFRYTVNTETTLNSNSYMTLYLPFRIDRNANISWGARIKVSTDNGQNFVYISTNQAYGAISYDSTVGNTAIFQMHSDALSQQTIYPIGSVFIFEIYKKQAISTELTTTVFCGVLVDGAPINTYSTFGVDSVSVDTSQIADGAVTLQKLAQDVQTSINNIVNKLDSRTNSTGRTEVYAYQNNNQGSLTVTNTPTNGMIPFYNSNNNIKSGTPVDSNDCATKGYVTGIFSLSGTTLTITTV